MTRRGGRSPLRHSRFVHAVLMDERRFTLDGLEEEWTWQAIRFGVPWNGWATPVVSEETLRDLLGRVADGGHRWDGDVAVVWPTIDLLPGEQHDPESEDRVLPDEEGRYDLRVLGWVFVSL